MAEDLLSQSEFYQEIKEIADSMGYSGIAVEIVNKLLSFAEYKNQTRCANIVLESSFLYSELLNTKIEHARSRMYSVFRGHNQKFKIIGITPTNTFSVKKFDLAATVNGLNLYYAEAYDFGQAIPTTIELIIGRECKTLSPLNYTGNEKIFLYYSDTDVSEDLMVYFNDVEQTTYSDFLKYIEYGHLDYEDYVSESGVTQRNTNSVFILTDKDYGITLVNQAIIQNTLGTYDIKAILYCTDTIKKENIKSIPNFKMPEDVWEGTTHKSGIEEVALQKRNEDLDKIFFQAITSWKSGFVVRSSTDFPNIINSILENEAKATNILIDYIESIILVYYVTEDFTPISAEYIAKIEEIQKAYYVNQEITVEQATPRNIQMDLVIYYDNKIPNRNTVENCIYDFQYQIGGEFNAYAVLAALLKLDDIVRVEFIPNTSIALNPKIALQRNEFPKITLGEVQFNAT